ncbi:carbohydrate esterase family 1 protein [Moniliophthora roreri MCA 2997]|uniref:Carbohydrate esterase family 1 protein n=2 Tax=Moniliophthora roreri TaxID=221103 RepID=V2XQ43_MONRO|nr:carbohydrate esterase family 1 protein [Moniliophthora roreri MCA 2997]
MLLKAVFSLLINASDTFIAAGQLEQANDFGASGIQMLVHRPAQLADPLPFIVGLTSEGFAVIWPVSWDVHHDTGGDPSGVASTVRYAIDSCSVGPSLVFVQVPSGAMVNNVMLDTCPDLFNTGVAVSRFPYGCFAGLVLWNNDCANGRIVKSAEE